MVRVLYKNGIYESDTSSENCKLLNMKNRFYYFFLVIFKVRKERKS